MATTENRAPRNTAGAIAKAAAGKPAKSETATMQSLITRMQPEIIRALPKHINSDRFTRIALTALRTTPGLAKCEPMSFIGGLLTLAQMGLEANSPLGEAYLLPFNNTKERRTDCQVVIGYKGYLNLLYRSGQVSSVQARVVYANDDFSYRFGLNPDITHIPARGDRGPATDYYAVIALKDGGYLFDVMSREEAEAHAKRYSKSVSNGPWSTAFDQMALKTILRRVLRIAPLSADLLRNLSSDESVKNEIAPDMSEVSSAYIIDNDTGEVVAEVEQAEPATESEGGSDVRAE